MKRLESVKVKAEAYSEPSRASMMELFCKNSRLFSNISGFVLNTPLERLKFSG